MSNILLLFCAFVLVKLANTLHYGNQMGYKLCKRCFSVIKLICYLRTFTFVHLLTAEAHEQFIIEPIIFVVYNGRLIQHLFFYFRMPVSDSLVPFIQAGGSA